ncbi:MAG: hypothetical protein QF915_02660 [Candidatus Woesearchaeota archaeon]|nr:hypothetical protein [Candidatus Woesearchaeota archaeon]MDP7458233.1 hypothetical protein [Candidatus Woesearchaeota archaeon]
MEDQKKEMPDSSVTKRCPNCQELSLMFSAEHKQLKCSKCGFQQDFKV